MTPSGSVHKSRDGGVVIYFCIWKIAKRGGEWLPSGATRGFYSLGMLELSYCDVGGLEVYDKTCKIYSAYENIWEGIVC